ncbi:hypothetical protein TNCV_4326021 [Trichonephila clavipes]|nr:hypothetical protein TNCV_4326021 [Trichonephila clavipes]
MWAANDLNEEEYRLIVIKTYPQCQCDRMIYSHPDGKLDAATELGSDVPAYCLQEPMVWDKSGEIRVKICYARQSEVFFLRRPSIEVVGAAAPQGPREMNIRLLKDGVPASAE